MEDLATSSLYESADLMRDQLQANLFNGQDVDVTIGRPSEAEIAVTAAKAVLNLFFYKIQPPGFFPDTGPNETWRARLHCLVTAFAKSELAGDDELKMIGQVLSYFHEHPTLKGKGEISKEFYWLEVIFQPLTSEEINQIWSTFGDVSYRTSLTYEVALIPVEPKVRAVPAPPVASGGTTRNVSPTAEPRYARPPVAPIDAEIGRIEVDLLRQDWAPAMAFVEAGEALPSLTKTWSDVEAVGGASFAKLWIDGEAGAEIDLLWQSGVLGTWTDLPKLLSKAKPIPAQNDPNNQLTLDPLATIAAVDGFNITNARVKPDELGIEKAPLTDTGAATQFLIRARRTLADGSSVKSNPLILNITGSQHMTKDGP